MGCANSKIVYAESKHENVEKLVHSEAGSTQIKEPYKELNTDLLTRAVEEADMPTTPVDDVSRAPSCAATDPSSSPGIIWKLDDDEILTMRTFKELGEINDMASMDLGIAKSKICLLGTSHVWFMVSTIGAFSPGILMAGFPVKLQADAFQQSNDTSVFVCEDLTKDPRFKNNPAVVHRPHLSYYVGAPLISRNTHFMGVIYLWESDPGKAIKPNQEKRLLDLAAKTVTALQRSMLVSIGPTAELPAVWLDMREPAWKVIGINPEWEKLTGVGLDTLTSSRGLLSVMMAADGADTELLTSKIHAAAEDLPPGSSLPAILSPKATSGRSLEFVVAIKRATSVPPLSATDSVVALSDLRMVEIHARIQSDVHKGNYSNVDLASTLYPREVSSTSSDLNPLLGGLHGSMPSRISSALSHTSTPASATGLSVPPRLSALTIGPLLGAGSFANVYAGMLGDRPVAVKIMNHSASSPDAEEQNWLAHYEALMTIDVSHDNLVATLDWCRVESPQGWQVWIVQELCEKGSLSTLLHTGTLRERGISDAGPDMRAILQTAREVARGMRYLHSMNEIHGDLSSNNILLAVGDNARGFVAKVADFGLSRVASQELMTKTCGTVSHQAQETLIEGIVTKAGDVYSYGVLMYEMYTGKRAWDGLSQAQVIFMVTCRGERLKMPEGAPAAYAALAMECMAEEREDRPTFYEIVPRIDAMLAELPKPVVLIPRTSARTGKKSSHD